MKTKIASVDELEVCSVCKQEVPKDKLMSGMRKPLCKHCFIKIPPLFVRRLKKGGEG